MSDTVIRVENLSKRYVIGHQAETAYRYTTLRDVISDRVKGLGHKLRRPYRPSSTPKTEEFWALKDVSFEIKQGEVVGIIGRNGAGKSTLLKVLSRITEPTAGRISIKGRIASLLEVGTGFHPELTGRENIFLNGAILGMSKSEISSKFDEIVDFAEIERFLDTPVKRYSSGMYVRLAFAVAAHLEPEILVIDEVLAVGDTKFQKKCLAKMSDASKNEGITLIFVSHNMTAIASLCEKCLYLNKGVKELFGSTYKVVEKYIENEVSSNSISWTSADRSHSNNSSSADILLVEVLNESESAIGLSIDKDLVVRIIFEKKTEKTNFYVSIHLNTLEGYCVFASVNFPSTSKDYWAAKDMPLGTYESRVFIPRNLLNDKKYSVNVLILDRKDMSVISFLESALSFDLVDLGEERNYFFGEWIGCTRPKLSWETQMIK